MKKWIFLLMLFFAIPTQAQLKEYEHAFDINLQEEIPMVWRVRKEYQQARNEYDWKYEYNWRLPAVFNHDFKKKIKNFGSIEKRIANTDEENILRMLKRLPKSMYPYIGPALHNVRGLSGKILDMPGIKETKNKFPEKIAERMQNIPDIEFASPELYIYLSPQFWLEDMQSLEFPQELPEQPKQNPKIRINPEFISRLKQKVQIDDFAFGSKPQTLDLDVRNYYADVNTALSGADVKAFIGTFAGLHKFREKKGNEIRLIALSGVINFWDEQQGINKYVAYFKNVVNPCQSIVRKVKWAGLRDEFQQAIGAQAFGLDDWAYTCDKVIKAYRITTLSNGDIASLHALRRGYFYKIYDKMDFTDEEREQQKVALEATLHLYDSSAENVAAVRPFAKQIEQELNNLTIQYGGSLIILP